MKENKEQQEFVTFRFYNSKGQRLTIYYNGNNEVSVLACTTDDQFVKYVGKNACITGKIADGNNPIKDVSSIEKFNITFYRQKDFLDWCRVNYFKQHVHRVIVHNVLNIKLVKEAYPHGVEQIIEYTTLYKEKSI